MFPIKKRRAGFGPMGVLDGSNPGRFGMVGRQNRMDSMKETGSEDMRIIGTGKLEAVENGRLFWRRWERNFKRNDGIRDEDH